MIREMTRYRTETKKAADETENINRHQTASVGIAQSLAGQLTAVATGYASLASVRQLIAGINEEQQRSIDLTRQYQEALVALKALDPSQARNEEAFLRDIAQTTGFTPDVTGPALHLLRSGTAGMPFEQQSALFAEAAEMGRLSPRDQLDPLAELFGTFSSITGVTDAGRVQNLLGSAAEFGKTTNARLAQFAPRFIGPFQQTGATPAEGLAMFSAISQVTGRNDEAATALRAFALSLARDDKADMRRRLGIEGMTPAQALRRLAATQDDPLGAITALAGAEAAGMGTLLEQPGKFEAALDFIGDAEFGGDFVGDKIARLRASDPGYIAQENARFANAREGLGLQDPGISEEARIRQDLYSIGRERGYGDFLSRNIGRAGSRVAQAFGLDVGYQTEIQRFFTRDKGAGEFTDGEVTIIVNNGDFVTNGGIKTNFDGHQFENERDRRGGPESGN